MSVEECSKLIGQYEATDQGKVEGLMSIDGENSEELEKTKNLYFCWRTISPLYSNKSNNGMPSTIGGPSVPWEAYSVGQMRDYVYVPLVHSGGSTVIRLIWSQFTA